MLNLVIPVKRLSKDQNERPPDGNLRLALCFTGNVCAISILPNMFRCFWIDKLLKGKYKKMKKKISKTKMILANVFDPYTRRSL